MKEFKEVTENQTVDEQAMTFLRAFVTEFQGGFEEVRSARRHAYRKPTRPALSMPLPHPRCLTAMPRLSSADSEAGGGLQEGGRRGQGQRAGDGRV